MPIGSFVKILELGDLQRESEFSRIPNVIGTRKIRIGELPRRKLCPFFPFSLG